MTSPELPPLLVRLSFRWHLPIQPQWRPWAMREIERRYGPNPSTDDRDIVIAPFIDPIRPGFDAFTSSGGRIPRRPLAIRKADEQYATGLRADGTPAPRATALVEMTAFFELLPQRLWPWIPVVLIVTALVIVAATAAAAVALS